MIGNFNAKVDEKGRLIVPAKLREELGDTFYVTVGVNEGHRCLYVFPKAAWAVLCQKYDALPIAQKSGANSLLFAFATECSPDKQFRFLLTPSLFDYAQITRDVVITGNAGQVQIWDAETFAQFQKDTMSPEKLLAALGAVGL